MRRPAPQPSFGYFQTLQHSSGFRWHDAVSRIGKGLEDGVRNPPPAFIKCFFVKNPLDYLSYITHLLFLRRDRG